MRHRRIFIILYLVSLSLVLSQASFSVQRNQRGALNTPNTPNLPAERHTEPAVRVGLATDAKSAVISTTGQLLHAVGEDVALKPLTIARIRVESRSISPITERTTGGEYQVEVAGLRNRAEAERASKDLASLTGQQTELTRATDKDEWAVRVGTWPLQREAKEIKDFLEGEGFIMARVVSSAKEMSAHAPTRRELASNQVEPRISVVPTARSSTPGGETVVFGSGNSQLFAARVPVIFSSSDGRTPVKFNEKSYRGRLEVFRNSRGSLTVVNVLGLEDYVKGVVANELSPEVFPELEALKAQAVAARTYAVRHRNQFASMGFDLLPTTRSQVYGGLNSERLLSSRAVDETRGLIATYNGEPIDALYTSTCGGRTENAEEIFGGASVPYLKAVECSIESHAAIDQFQLKTGREPIDISDERNIDMARVTALLAVHGFSLPKRLTDKWLLAQSSASEVDSWLSVTSRLARQAPPAMKGDIIRPGGFASALSLTVYGEDRGAALLSKADVDYYLPFRDAGEIAMQQRAAIALLVREGVITPFPDGLLHPDAPMSRARVLRAIARILESRQLFDVRRAVARPSSGSKLLVKAGKGSDQTLALAPNTYLLALTGGSGFQVRSLSVIGGESVGYHVGTAGNVDYLEVRPAQNGASADRFSTASTWTVELSLAEVAVRLSRYIKVPGTVTDIRVVERGASRRVTELEIIGSGGVSRLKGGRIRSALGLKDQLFVVDRQFDSQGRVSGIMLSGRGFGHGVGMCQVGSFGLAKAGYSFKEILDHYYTGIDLSRIY